ncbi:MAG TPA: TlpA disulfide reductase family protein [Candidatus Dormibacteraeota bacterium]|jgi:DsbE subfamily thiol:disulfide oxidoreductase|nr:TlpA disulfide reductase family protein [Candidatus Dormibacteraeota bacterium]
MRRLAALVLLSLGVLSGCSLQGPLNGADTSSAVIGHAAPAFSGTTLDGRPISLADFKGQPVVLDFWAAWCGPCRAEQPGLTKIAADLSGSGVRLVGVDVRDEVDQAKVFRDEFQMPYPSVFDQAGRLEFAYQVDAPPSTILIDAGGVVRDRIIGQISETGLRSVIRDKLLRPGGASPGPTPSTTPGG